MAKSSSSILDLQDILSELECPICMEIFNPPIYTCTAGHSICSSCRSSVSECPSCKSTFSNARNYSLEKIVSVAQRRCKYFDQGCNEILKGDLYNSHIKSCSYRELKCLCCEKNEIQYTEFLQHLRDKHANKMEHSVGGVASRTFCIKYFLSRDLLPNKGFMVTFFKFNNDVVIFVQRQLRDGILFFSLWKFPYDSVSLICNMKLSLGPRFMVSWLLKINSYRTTFTENIENGSVAAIPCGTVFYNTEVNPVDQSHRFSVTYEIQEE